MQHSDHVALLRPGVHAPGGTWAEFGPGAGAFTLALAELLGPTATLYAIDRDAAALREAARCVAAHVPGLTLLPVTGDFTQALPVALPPLDGAVMANALHFVPDRHKDAALARLKSYLKPGAPFIVVEYNVDKGNLWVPHPLSYGTWQTLAGRAGFAHTQLLGTRPSSFLREFFSAASF
jgi:ubiquinone/menaquinone biosynthesis C-methylase UbiE